MVVHPLRYSQRTLCEASSVRAGKRFGEDERISSNRRCRLATARVVRLRSCITLEAFRIVEQIIQYSTFHHPCERFKPACAELFVADAYNRIERFARGNGSLSNQKYPALRGYAGC